jgi:general secretion pathway protein A
MSRLSPNFPPRLLQEARAGKRMIVVIDEAQNLAPEVLETVRLLSDFETPRAKLMHIILSGQPQLADKLASPSMAQLRQRVSILHGLEALTSAEVKNYIEHRLKIAGYTGVPLFTPEAYRAISEFSEGIPRNVNNFCFNALSLACAVQKKMVDTEVVQEVISDLDISKLTSGAPTEELSFEAFAAAAPSEAVPAVTAGNGNKGDILTPAEAAAYMQEVVMKLRNWQRTVDKSGASSVRKPRMPLRNDVGRS